MNLAEEVARGPRGIGVLDLVRVGGPVEVGGHGVGLRGRAGLAGGAAAVLAGRVLDAQGQVAKLELLKWED